MVRAKAAHLILILLLIVAAALAVSVFQGTSQPDLGGLSQDESSAGPMSIRGFDFATYEGDRLATRVQAGQFRVKPRKFGIFKLRSVNEVALSKARLEIHRPPEQDGKNVGVLSPLGEQLGSRAQGLLGGKGVGNITRAVMDGVELVFYGGGSPHLRVSAQAGEMDFRSKEIRMREAVLEHLPSQRKIASKVIVWDEREGLFRVPGAYQATTPKGRATGRGISVDLDFRVEKLPRSETS